MIAMIGFVILALVGVLTVPILFYSTDADISIKEPLNWQASPNNNSTSMVWFQNSTQSMFTITKIPLRFNVGLFLIVDVMAQAMAESGMLESIDQITFGHSNFGYKFVLNGSSPNATSEVPTKYGSYSLPNSPFNGMGPMKASIILSQKYNDTYGIALMSPRDNFEGISNEIKPTLDSIKITKSALDTKTKWTEYNSTLGVSLVHPANWTLEQQRDDIPYDSLCNSATGTCFNIINIPSGFNDTQLDQVSRVWLNLSLMLLGGINCLVRCIWRTIRLMGKKRKCLAKYTS